MRGAKKSIDFPLFTLVATFGACVRPIGAIFIFCRFLFSFSRRLPDIRLDEFHQLWPQFNSLELSRRLNALLKFKCAPVVVYIILNGLTLKGQLMKCKVLFRDKHAVQHSDKRAANSATLTGALWKWFNRYAKSINPGRALLSSSGLEIFFFLFPFKRESDKRRKRPQIDKHSLAYWFFFK